MNVYTSGALVRVSAAFRNAQDVLADPSGGVTLLVQKGTRPAVAVTPVIRDDEGLYHVNLDTTGVTAPGVQEWAYQFAGAGDLQVTSDPASFGVQPAAL